MFGFTFTYKRDLPFVALTLTPTVGAGVTAADGVDGAEVPTVLVAVTVNVYAVPLVSPDTVQVVAAGVEQVLPSGEEVTS